jgi:hypothetical protein
MSSEFPDTVAVGVPMKWGLAANAAVAVKAKIAPVIASVLKIRMRCPLLVH